MLFFAAALTLLAISVALLLALTTPPSSPPLIQTTTPSGGCRLCPRLRSLPQSNHGVVEIQKKAVEEMEEKTRLGRMEKET